MAIGESLSILIGANADPLIREMDKAQRAIAEWGGEVKEHLESVRAAGEAMGALLGVSVGGGMAEMVKSTLENVASLQEQADQLGLNVEKFQALRFAAQQSGVDMDTFSLSLNKLSKLLGEAQAGSDEAQKTFEKWGISITPTTSLSELLAKVEDRFASIADPALRSAAAVDMFGKAGYSMINFMSKGSEEIANLENKARELGAVLDRETTQKAKEAKEQLEAMGDVINANLAVAIVKILPSAETLADVLHKISLGARDLFGSEPDAMSQMDSLPSRIADVTRKIAELRSEKEKSADADYTDANGIEHLNGMYDQRIKKLEQYRQSLINMQETAGSAIGGVDGGIGGGISAGNPKKGQPFRPKIEKDDGEDAPDNKGQQQLADYIAKLQEENYLLGLNADEREVQKNLLEAEAIARKADIDLTDEQRFAIIDYTKSIQQQNEQVEEAKKKMEEAKQFSSQLASSMTSSLEKAITSGQGLRQVFAGLVEDIEKMILRMAVLKPLSDTLSTAFMGGAGSTGGGLFGALFGGFRASGGDVRSGMPYIVGERGPELIVPTAGGTVIPNNRLNAGGSSPQSNSFNFNVTVNGAAAGNPQLAAQSGAAFATAARAHILLLLQEQTRPGGVLY